MKINYLLCIVNVCIIFHIFCFSARNADQKMGLGRIKIEFRLKLIEVELFDGHSTEMIWGGGVEKEIWIAFLFPLEIQKGLLG